MLGPYLFVYNNNVYYFSDFFNDNRLRVTKLPSAMPPSCKAKEKTDVKSPERKNLLLVNKLTFTSCSFAKKVDQRGLSFKPFSHTNSEYTSFPRPHVDWASVIGYQEREFLSVSFGCIVLSACAQVKLWCRIKNAFLASDFLYKNEVSDNFPWKIHHNKFHFSTCIIHDSYWHQSMKKTKMMFYTSDKLTNVFECVMFVSQFHVHC